MSKKLSAVIRKHFYGDPLVKRVLVEVAKSADNEDRVLVDENALAVQLNLTRQEVNEALVEAWGNSDVELFEEVTDQPVYWIWVNRDDIIGYGDFARSMDASKRKGEDFLVGLRSAAERLN